MAALAIIVALVVAALGHYVFSFQRFTRSIAILNGGPIPQVQTLMTPGFMGALGWIYTLGQLVASALLWLVFGWTYAVGYFVVVSFLSGFLLPLFRSQRFFSLALGELQRHYEATEDTDARRLITRLRRIIEETLHEGLW
jgi:hypothetical protein